jgi:hypothetical protein
LGRGKSKVKSQNPNVKTRQGKGGSQMRGKERTDAEVRRQNGEGRIAGVRAGECKGQGAKGKVQDAKGKVRAGKDKVTRTRD